MGQDWLQDGRENKWNKDMEKGFRIKQQFSLIGIVFLMWREVSFIDFSDCIFNFFKEDI